MLTVASAQLILATAVSGCPPYSPPTCAAQPRTPSRRSVVVTARRIWSGEGDPDGCRADRNNASARTASNVPGISRPASDVFVAIVGASLPSTFAAWGLTGVRAAYCPASRSRPLMSSRPAPNPTTGQQESGDYGQQQRMTA